MNRILVLILVVSLGLFLFVSLDDEVPQSIDETVTASFSSTDREVILEVADDPGERRTGLMHRREMSADRGMLFTYGSEDYRSFWMKNTYIPLDIIFLNSTGHVINVETAQPEPDTSEQNLKRYRSEKPARYVIELNAGFSENHSISKGTKVDWDR